MNDHKTGTREEWLAARLELLKAEKELTRRSDELARRRQELPWVRNQWLDRAPRGRNETGFWFRHHDEDYAAGWICRGWCPRVRRRRGGNSLFLSLNVLRNGNARWLG